MKPTLVKLEIIDQPEIVVIGKLIRFNLDASKAQDNPPALWNRSFADGTFPTLEALPDHVQDPSYVGAYVGYMDNYDPATGAFDYIAGMMFKPGILKSGEPAVPEGFISRTLKPTKVAVAWIKGQKGKESEMYSTAHDLTVKALEEKGMKPAGGPDGWCMEVYSSPRFTKPDADGNIILDYYIPCE